MIQTSEQRRAAQKASRDAEGQRVAEIMTPYLLGVMDRGDPTPLVHDMAEALGVNTASAKLGLTALYRKGLRREESGVSYRYVMDVEGLKAPLCTAWTSVECGSVVKRRACLTCRDEFWSTGAGNRMCFSCRQSGGLGAASGAATRWNGRALVGI